MSCNNSCNQASNATTCCRGRSGVVILIVLYILLAIILGSYVRC